MKNLIIILVLISITSFFLGSCCDRNKSPDPVTDCGCPDTSFVCDNDSLQCHCPNGEMMFNNHCYNSSIGYYGVMENCNTCFDTILVSIVPEGGLQNFSIYSMDGTREGGSGGFDYYHQGSFGDSLHMGGAFLNCNINGVVCDAEISGRYSVDKSTLRLWFRFYPFQPLNIHQTIQTCSTTLTLH